MSKNTKLGELFIVATPIGNLDDLSNRAIKTLSNVDICAAEDTRTSKVLFDRFGIKTELVSYHEFSESKKLNFFISKLKNGKNIALISEAGTPLISDPGYKLVKKAHKELINVITIPGPSSLTAALSISGMPTDRFIFYGFPHRQTKARKKFLHSVASNLYTSVIFESGRRIEALLQELIKLSPKREVFIVREMTKKHESFYMGNLEEVIVRLKSDQYAFKGEFVIVVKGIISEQNSHLLTEAQKDTLKILMDNLSKKEALSLASKVFGISKNSLYKILLNKIND